MFWVGGGGGQNASARNFCPKTTQVITELAAQASKFTMPEVAVEVSQVDRIETHRLPRHRYEKQILKADTIDKLRRNEPHYKIGA